LKVYTYHGKNKNVREQALAKFHNSCGHVVLTTYGVVGTSSKELGNHDTGHQGPVLSKVVRQFLAYVRRTSSVRFYRCLIKIADIKYRTIILRSSVKTYDSVGAVADQTKWRRCYSKIVNNVEIDGFLKSELKAYMESVTECKWKDKD